MSFCLPRAIMSDLYHLYREESQRSLHAGQIWRLSVQPRVSLFLWKVAWRQLPIRFFLITRGLHLSSTCPGCGHKGEDAGACSLFMPTSQSGLVIGWVRWLNYVGRGHGAILFGRIKAELQRSQDHGSRDSGGVYCLSYLAYKECPCL